MTLWETQGGAQESARHRGNAGQKGEPQKATLPKEGQGDDGVGPTWQATAITRPPSQHAPRTQR